MGEMRDVREMGEVRDMGEVGDMGEVRDMGDVIELHRTNGDNIIFYMDMMEIMCLHILCVSIRSLHA